MHGGAAAPVAAPLLSVCVENRNRVYIPTG